jgi:hypothetical protein
MRLLVKLDLIFALEETGLEGWEKEGLLKLLRLLRTKE